MNRNTIFILAPFLIYFLIALYDSRTIDSLDDYFLAGRDLSTQGFVTNAVVTNYSFLTMVFVLGYWGFAYGSGAWWTIITMAAGFLLFCIARISPAGQEEFISEGHTVHQFLGQRYGSSALRAVASLTTSVAYVGYFIASIYVAASFFSPVIGISNWHLVLAFAAAIIVYTVLGGYRSVVKTDDIQFLLILTGCVVITVALFDNAASLGKIFTSATDTDAFFTPSKGFPYIISLFLLNGLWQLFAMDMWQRTLSTGDGGKAIYGSAVTSIVWSLIAVPIILMGMFVAIIGGGIQSPVQAVNAFIGSIQNEWFVGAFYGSLVGALISSQDSNLAALSQTIQTDVLEPWDTEGDTVAAARWTVAVSGLLGVAVLYLLVAVLGFDLVTFLLTFFSAQLVLFPSLLVAFLGWHTDMSRWYPITSIVLGFIVAFALGLYSLTSPKWQFWTPIVGLGVAVVPFGIKTIIGVSKVPAWL